MENISFKILLKAFELEPKKAVEYLESKGFEISDNWKETLEIVKKHVFTISKVTKMDVLTDAMALLQEAIKGDIDLKEFKEGFRDSLKKAGWYDTPAGDRDKNLDTNWRINQIYRTNISNAYNHGRFTQSLDGADRMPLLREVATKDGNTTEICSYRANKKIAVRLDDKLLKMTYPPSHWGCRKVDSPINESVAKRFGLTVMAVKDIPKKYWNEKDFRNLPTDVYKPDLKKYEQKLRDYYEDDE